MIKRLFRTLNRILKETIHQDKTRLRLKVIIEVLNLLRLNDDLNETVFLRMFLKKVELQMKVLSRILKQQKQKRILNFQSDQERL